MIIAVAGSGTKAGKTTFCNMFLKTAEGKKFKYCSTSDALIDILSEEIDIPVNEIKDNKEQYRKQLVKLGKKDPMQAIRCALSCVKDEEFILFESVRKKEEFEYLKERKAIFIFVQASTHNRMKRGAGTIDINEVEPLLLTRGEPIRNCYLVRNDGTKGNLKTRTKHIAQILC